MEPFSANAQEASENHNIGDQTTKNTIKNQDNINSNSLNDDISNNDNLYKFDDTSPRYQTRQEISVDNHINSKNPTVIFEINDDDDNNKSENDSPVDQEQLNPNQDDTNTSKGFFKPTPSYENAMNKFMSSNLKQGELFTNDKNYSINDRSDPSSLLKPQQAIQSNDKVFKIEYDIGKQESVPELRRSGTSDSILNESKSPSNITTEENSPKSRPFSPDATNSPLSPPSVDKIETNTKNDETPFKTLSIYGSDDESSNSNKTIISTPKIIRLTMNPYSSLFRNPNLEGTPTNEYTGLQNQGATCYMNSMLQALYNLPIFRRFIYQMDYSEAASDEQNIPLNLQRLFAMMQLKIQSSVSTKELTNSFGWTANETYMQHDVQEFCRVILDNIETKMKKQEDLKDAIGYLFRGKVRSEIRLKSNNEVLNSNTEDFYDLSMLVKDTNSLEESFQKYIEPETISDYDTANGKQEISRAVEFVQFPPVLYIHLRRFEYDQETKNMKKINSCFEYPESIDLSCYMAGDADQTECQIFDLFGVLVHSGSSYSGHYFAYLKPSGEDDEWFLFNDSSVSKVPKEEAIESNYGGCVSQNGIPIEKSYSAYMLIYIRRSRVHEFYQVVTDDEIPESASNYVHEKKLKIERKIEEKKRIENTIYFKLFSNDDLRKNALKCNISFEFKSKSLTSIDVMKYDLPEDLYQKVHDIFKLNKFVLYVANTQHSFDELNKDSNYMLESLCYRCIYVYSDFKENRIAVRRKKYRKRTQFKPDRSNNDENNSDNQGENVKDDQSFGGECLDDEIVITNHEEDNANSDEEANNNDGNNENEETNNNVGNANSDEETNNNDGNANSDEETNNNDGNEGDNKDENVNDENEGDNNGNEEEADNPNIIYNNESENNEVENENESTHTNDRNEGRINNEYEYEEDEEEDKNGDGIEEEEEEEDDEEEYDESAASRRNYYNSYYDPNSTILVFYFIYIKKEPKHPIRFWRADRLKSKNKASYIFNKCDRILKVYPNALYSKMVGSQRYSQVNRRDQLLRFGNGTIFVIEIDSKVPKIIRDNDHEILQKIREETQNGEEDEDDESIYNNKIINYLELYPTNSFQEFLIFHSNQVKFEIKYEDRSDIIKIPFKISNDRFMKFVKKIFKINKKLSVIFYNKKSQKPLDIVPNNQTLEKSLYNSNDIILYCYSIPLNMSHDMFLNSIRVTYFTGDGFLQHRKIKHVFMSYEAKVSDLIEHKCQISKKKTKYRVITLYDNKISIEDPENLVAELRGKIRVEEVPEEVGDFSIQLSITKEASSHLGIFNRYKSKSKFIKKGNYSKLIECIFPGYDNEMLPDTKRRIADTFRCDYDRMDDLLFNYEDPNSDGKYSHYLTDIDAISESFSQDDDEYDSLPILKVSFVHHHSNAIVLQTTTTSSAPQRNHDSIYIQN